MIKCHIFSRTGTEKTTTKNNNKKTEKISLKNKCTRFVIANFAENVFLLLKTSHFSTCSAIVLHPNNFFDFQASAERATK
jgi:hypothetical protein